MVKRVKKRGKARDIKPLLTAMGIIRERKKQIRSNQRRLTSPQIQALRKRYEQLQQKQPLRNTDGKALLHDFRQRQLQELLKRQQLEQKISPSLAHQLNQVSRIQLKSKTDDLSMQRRVRERKILESSMNLMKAHKNLNKVNLDFTGVNPEENILMARNVFKEDLKDHILKKKRPSVLETMESGHNLRF